MEQPNGSRPPPSIAVQRYIDAEFRVIEALIAAKVPCPGDPPHATERLELARALRDAAAANLSAEEAAEWLDD